MHALMLDQYRISKWRYHELKAFCRQYDDKRKAAQDLLGVSAVAITGMPHGSGVGRPTEDAALKRERYLIDIKRIEDAASQAGGGAWVYALVENCCRGVSYDRLTKSRMPTSKRSVYFAVRREFFWLLDQSGNDLMVLS